MPEKTIKRRLQDCDTALASDHGPIFSTVAKLVETLERSIPEGTQNAEQTKIALVRWTRCAIASGAKPTAPPIWQASVRESRSRRCVCSAWGRELEPELLHGITTIKCGQSKVRSGR
jgi:hypothetical protein